MAQAQEGRENARDDEDGEQDDERCCKGRRRHADVTLGKERGVIKFTFWGAFGKDLGLSFPIEG